MKKSNFNWRNKIFTRLLITFFTVMIPIYVLGINIYNWGIRTVQREIRDSMVSQVDFYLNNFETEIQRIRILQYDFFNDEDLNMLATASQIMEDYEQFKAALRLQQRLFAIKSSSVYIKNVSANIPQIGRTISTARGVDNLDLNLMDMNDPKKYPLQSYLQTVVIVKDFALLAHATKEELEVLSVISDRTTKASQVFIAALPILAVYPLLQKYFVKGIVLGSVKG